MANFEVALNLGSDFISVSSPKVAFLVKEPSVIAVDEVDVNNIKAIGTKAIKLNGSPMAKVKLIRPILEGCIIDNDKAVVLIKYLFEKLLPRGAMFSKIVVSCIVPCGMSKADKRNIELALNSVGVRQTTFVEAVLADSAKIFADFNTNRGIICDVGADTVDIAAIVNGNILTGCTVYCGGKAIDKAVSEMILNKYGVQISKEEAERLKNSCASLYPNDVSATNVEGINISKGLLESVNVTAREMYDTVVNVVKKYISIIDSIFLSVSTESVGLLKEEGIFLCGGVANLTGLDKYFLDTLKLNTRIPRNPEDVTVKGGVILLQKEVK